MSTTEITMKKMAFYRPRPIRRERRSVITTWQEKHFSAWWLEQGPREDRNQRKIDIEMVTLLEASLRRFG